MKVKTEDTVKESWVKSKWRPMMAWVYMAVVVFDFIVAPIFWTVWQCIYASGDVAQQWAPMTLVSGGLFHMAMGAILGVTAWSRGQEKMQGVAGDSYYESENSHEEQTPV